MQFQCPNQVPVKVRIGENWKNIFEEDAFAGEIWELAERIMESYLKIGEFGGLQTMSEYRSADATFYEDSSVTHGGGRGGGVSEPFLGGIWFLFDGVR